MSYPLSSDIFTEVKAVLSAETVLSHFLGRSQARKFLCPFHDDKTPSLSAHGSAIRCFGCQWAGDIFRFLEDYHGIGRGESLRICADLAGIVLPDRTPAARDGRRLRLPSLTRSHAQVLRESEKISGEITVTTRRCAADAWRRAWDARGSEAVWDAVEIGASLDREIALMEMETPCDD